jgi:Amt family ammonium transporter
VLLLPVSLRPTIGTGTGRCRPPGRREEERVFMRAGVRGRRAGLLYALFAFAAAWLVPGLGLAASPGTAALRPGDEAWMLASSALVLLMTPGLAFFYGGMVRRKNVITTMLQVFAAVAVVSVQWVLFGYSLAFGPDVGHVIGSLAWVGFRHVGAAPDPAYAPSVPNELYAIFQMMFAIITPALIVGGLAERMRFKAFLLFTLLWSTFVYDPLAHWVWGYGGWLRDLGVLDFAGGTVVHISSGVAGLVTAILLGKRHGLGRDEHIRAHNLPLVLLGTALLWFGWFGFNAGSAGNAGPLAASAFLTTNTAAAMASLAWIAIEWLRTGKPTLMGACAGAVCGLVAVTPAAGFVGPLGSMAIGLGAGAVCYLAAAVLKTRFGYDDALDAFGGHGVGGTWGALATGLFAQVAVNAAGANGLLYGNPRQLLLQLVGVLAAAAFSALGTWAIFRVVDRLVGCRVTPEEEEAGLDAALHGEDAYPEQVTWGGLSDWLPAAEDRPRRRADLRA